MAEVKLKGTPVQTNGMLPKVGSKAPDFVLVDSHLKDKTLEDYKGKKKVISIVPSLDTPTCLLSAKKFNEESGKISQAVILVVSCDLPFAQKRVCGAEKMDHVIPLSLMRSKKFAEDYGVLIQDGPLKGICARAIVVLDENNKVLHTELVEEISQEPNYAAALKALES